MRLLAVLLVWGLAADTVSAEPLFQRWAAQRQLRITNRIAADVCQHAPTDHLGRYEDFGTVVHEQQHRTNGYAHLEISRRFGRPTDVVYCLEDRVAVLDHPTTVTLTRLAAAVPTDLRGPGYRTYLQQYDRAWEQHPTYMLDEWLAYTHECLAMELQPGGPAERSAEALAEFLIYSAILSRLDPANQPVRELIRWNVPRVRAFIQQQPRSLQYWRRLDRLPHRELRQHLREQLGAEW